MALDTAILSSLTRRFEPIAYLRCTPWTHRATPLGMGYGKTRFASPTDQFKLLYIAEDLATGIAETVVRDRFEGAAIRELDITDIRPWGVCQVDAVAPLRVLDLRRDGCFKLGISTDIVGAKAQDQSRTFSQMLYDTTDLDGILYHSRLRRRNCVAVYDRAVSSTLRPGAVVELETLARLAPALRALKIMLNR
jgi:hypothetical protein